MSSQCLINRASYGFLVAHYEALPGQSKTNSLPIRVFESVYCLGRPTRRYSVTQHGTAALSWVNRYNPHRDTKIYEFYSFYGINE